MSETPKTPKYEVKPEHMERLSIAYNAYKDLYVDPFWNWDARSPTFTETQLPLWWHNMEIVLAELEELGVDVEEETPSV